MSIRPDDPGIRIALAKGLLTPEQVGTPARGRKVPAPLVEPEFWPGIGRAEWVIPLKTESNVNHGGANVGRQIGAKARAWRAVGRDGLCRELRTVARFQERVAAGKRVRVTLVRIGPGKIDELNRGDYLKFVADAVAFLLGCDDSDPRLVWVLEGEKGKAYGVRILLSLEG
jgi:hypothetical protein